MTTLWPNRAVQRIVFPELVERRPGMVAIMGRAARLIILSSLVLLFTGAETRAFELELIERLPGAIDDHTVVMLDGARAMVAWERDESAPDGEGDDLRLDLDAAFRSVGRSSARHHFCKCGWPV